MDYKIDYNEQMLNYYPEIIKAIREFQLLIKTQALEVEEMHKELTRLLGNSYITTADEATIRKWEQLLNITPLPRGEDTLETWLEDRQETILARLYNAEKLNEKSIADLVKIFTGGSCVSYFKDGTIHVLINPPEGSKQYKFTNVEQEISKKIPAHLMFQVSRNYYTWLENTATCETWMDVNDKFADWGEFLYTTLYVNKLMRGVI